MFLTGPLYISTPEDSGENRVIPFPFPPIQPPPRVFLFKSHAFGVYLASP